MLMCSLCRWVYRQESHQRRGNQGWCLSF